MAPKFIMLIDGTLRESSYTNWANACVEASDIAKATGKPVALYAQIRSYTPRREVDVQEFEVPE